MIRTVLLFSVVVLLIGCNEAGKADSRICDIISEAYFDVSPDPRELQVVVKQCNGKNYELVVSLTDKMNGSGLVLIKQDLGNLKPEPTISSLEIQLNKGEFREYTLNVPGYVGIEKYMSLRTINSKRCLELKDIDLCFEQQS